MMILCLLQLHGCKERQVEISRPAFLGLLYMYISICIYIHANIYAYIYEGCIYVHIHTLTIYTAYVCMRMNIYIHICIYIYICACIHRVLPCTPLPETPTGSLRLRGTCCWCGKGEGTGSWLSPRTTYSPQLV